LLSAAALVALIAAALYGSLHHPPAEVKVTMAVTALRFLYHPVPENDPPGLEKPLLSGAPLRVLSVRSFDTLTAFSGVLSVRDSARDPWTVVQTPAPIEIRSKDASTKAIFSGGAVQRWRLGELPTVTLEFINQQPILHATFEGKDINLFFEAGESIEFQCQLCVIAGVDQQAPSRPREMKLSEMKHAPRASSQRTLVLDAVPGPAGFGVQRFRMSQPWFCGGQQAEAESSIVSGSVTFQQTGRVHTLSGRASVNRPGGVLRLIPDSDFVVTDLGVEDVGSEKRKESVLKLQFDGLARRAELPANCYSSGPTFQPSFSEVLAATPVVAAPYAALVLLFGWLATYDKVRGLWKRVRDKGDDK